MEVEQGIVIIVGDRGKIGAVALDFVRGVFDSDDRSSTYPRYC